jgi:hypothetical protein
MLERPLKMRVNFAALATGHRFKLLRKAFTVDRVAKPEPFCLIQQPGVKILRFPDSTDGGSSSWRHLPNPGGGLNT